MITQCPNCQIRFRLPLDQVATSRGEVFCGECHTQFNALDYLVIEEGTQQGKPTLTERAQKKDEKESDNTLFLPIDENAIANLLSEDLASKMQTDEQTESAKEPLPEEKPPQLTPITQSSSFFTDTLIQPALQPQAEQEGLAEDTQSTKSARPDTSGSKSSIPELDSSQKESRNYTLNQPLEESSSEHHGSLGSTILSSVVVLFLITTLGLQYLVIQHEHFSQHRYFRPLLATICPHIDCTLPPKRDLSLLTVANNRVETHPQSPNALLITAELTNQGSFEQSYPVVELVMTNIQQEMVSRRNFYPREYIPGFSKSETKYFAANSRERLQLEVIDPGSHAIGFEFLIHN